MCCGLWLFCLFVCLYLSREFVCCPMLQTQSQLLKDRPLFVHANTYQCGMNKCIPCVYKMFPLGLSGVPPNTRPEVCPRARNPLHSNPSTLGLYHADSNILTVGDGDFSFSLSLASQFTRYYESSTSRKSSKGSSSSDSSIGGSKLVCTSYESKESLLVIYPHFDNTLARLNQLGAVVLHDVDASIIASSLNNLIDTTDLKFDGKINIHWLIFYVFIVKHNCYIFS